MKSPFFHERIGTIYVRDGRCLVDIDGVTMVFRSGAGAAGFHAQCDGHVLVTLDAPEGDRRPLDAREWAQVARGMATAVGLDPIARVYKGPELVRP